MHDVGEEDHERQRDGDRGEQVRAHHGPARQRAGQGPEGAANVDEERSGLGVALREDAHARRHHDHAQGADEIRHPTADAGESRDHGDIERRRERRSNARQRLADAFGQTQCARAQARRRLGHYTHRRNFPAGHMTWHSTMARRGITAIVPPPQRAQCDAGHPGADE